MSKKPGHSTPVVLDYKTTVAVEGLPRHLQASVLQEVPQDIQKVICDFLYDIVNRENVSQNTKTMYVKNLIYLMRATNYKPLSEMVREDILSYLHSLRRPPALDPDQKWISTHNNRVVMYQKFFKWLAHPDQPPRERAAPDIVRDIPLHKKKEKTHVKAKDLWTPEEDAIFLKYCEDPRLQFYHMGALDTSARPHELLKIRIGDVKIKYADDKMYAEVEVGRGGKTKSRTVPLIFSLPYFKALLDKHPEPGNPGAFVFRSLEHSARFRNVTLSPASIACLYHALKTRYFPKLLERADVPPEDKAKIRVMLQKPWNPYIRRHTSLTEKAKILNEYSLRLHAGWTKTSQMVEIYTHELGGESSAMLLEAYGMRPRENAVLNSLQPTQCPHCKEPNKHDSKFRLKCGMVLCYAALDEVKADESEQRELLEKKHREEMMEIREELRNEMKQQFALLAGLKPSVVQEGMSQ
jgi:hypothetical protein